MAWQLQYTSAESGPTGRAGFQFTAETPGPPPGIHVRLGPYLGYKPPPSATITPTAEQVRGFPVALAYGPLGDRFRVLSRCVYLGRDYSGRYGNFLGHALVVAPAELAGLRPVELWDAELWPDAPAPPGTALPEPTDLVPGGLADPESLGEWLMAGGDAAYARLGVLLATTWQALRRGHGRLILVHERIAEIVRWIAVISYSLPWPLADRLSFVTYSGDPANAAQTVVGTTPDVWIPAETDATVVRLAEPSQTSDATGDRAPPTRFTRTVVACWKSMDLAAIDAIAELAGETADPEAGAALFALCRGDETVTPREQAAIATLPADRWPDWVCRDLGRVVDRMGFELASAVAATAPPAPPAPPDPARPPRPGGLTALAGLAERCAVRCVVLSLRDRTLPPPARNLPENARQALVPAVAESLRAARDLDAVAHVIRVARSAGVAVPRADLTRAVRDLAPAGTAGLRAAIDAAPADLRDALIAGLVDGLDAAPPQVRERALAQDAVRALLTTGEWPHAPRISASLILADVRSGRLSRVEATLRLMALPTHHNPPSAQDQPAEHSAPADHTPPGQQRPPRQNPSSDHQPTPHNPPTPNHQPPKHTPPTHPDRTSSHTPAAQERPPRQNPPSDHHQPPKHTPPTDPDRSSSHTPPAEQRPLRLASPVERGRLVDRDADPRDAALRALWRASPSPGECESLIARLGAGIGASPVLSDLPARAYLAVGPDGPAAVRLARLVRDNVPGYATCDAEAVLSVARAAEADDPRQAAGGLDRLTELAAEVDENLQGRLRTAVALALTRRSPTFRTAVLRSTTEQTGRWLIGEWLRRPRLNRAEQLALLEIAIRLNRAGRIIASLDAWARERANGWSLFGWVDSHFKHDAELAAGLRELKHPRNPTKFRRGRSDQE